MPYRGIGSYGPNRGGGDYVDRLPGVSDPDKVYAQITRDEYMDLSLIHI